MDVQVLEPDPTLALASSARSAASIRQQFSNAVNVQMSRFGWQVLSQPEQWLAVDGQVPALGLVQSGYLFLAGTPQRRRPAGPPTARCSRPRVRPCKRWTGPHWPGASPWLNTADLLAANLGLQHEGWFDGEAYARALAAKARHLGAHLAQGPAWWVACPAPAARRGTRCTAFNWTTAASWVPMPLC